MVHGGGAKSYDDARAWLYRHEEHSRDLLQLLTDVIVDYLVEQVVAGAQMLEVFDSWAGDLSPDLFRRFSLPYLAQIASRVKQGLRQRGLAPVPMTCFARGAHFALAWLAEETEYDVLSLDWSVDPATAFAATRGKKSLQGNLDPSVLFADDAVIEREVKKMVDGFGTQR
jgi:uroporphyrinogen decarboxylase